MISHLRDVTAANRVTAVAVSDDGSLLAVGTEKAVELFAVTSGKALRKIQWETAASGLAFSTDNRLLAVATDVPTVTVHDRESGEITHRTGVEIGNALAEHGFPCLEFLAIRSASSRLNWPVMIIEFPNRSRIVGALSTLPSTRISIGLLRSVDRHKLLPRLAIL